MEFENGQTFAGGGSVNSLKFNTLKINYLRFK